MLSKMRIKENSTDVERHPNRGISAIWATFLTPLFLIASGCVVANEENPQGESNNGSPGDPSEDAEENEGDSETVASSATTSTTLGSDLQVQIYPLERIDDEFIKLNIRIDNNSEERYLLQDAFGDTENSHSASQTTLIDPEAQTRHLRYEQSDGSCYCSTAEGGIDSGESTKLWIMFQAPPTEVETLTVTTPVTAPFFDVPIQESTESYETQNLTAGDIIPLTMISDDLEDNTGRSESGEEVSILLSSDVLFETGSSDLTSDSEEIIEQVASEIDQSSSQEVKVDGHADDTGEDSVNIPLSEDRAQAVEEAVSDLITRDEINFETEGHGSADPIADNDTEEGKDRNRRVTVTFEK